MQDKFFLNFSLYVYRFVMFLIMASRQAQPYLFIYLYIIALPKNNEVLAILFGIYLIYRINISPFYHPGSVKYKE